MIKNKIKVMIDTGISFLFLKIAVCFVGENVT